MPFLEMKHVCSLLRAIVGYPLLIRWPEARALRDGLILAGNIGCNKLVVEADRLEVIELMQAGGYSIGPAAAIYDEL